MKNAVTSEYRHSFTLLSAFVALDICCFLNLISMAFVVFFTLYYRLDVLANVRVLSCNVSS